MVNARLPGDFPITIEPIGVDARAKPQFPRLQARSANQAFPIKT
jgi:hypothetical protein